MREFVEIYTCCTFCITAKFSFLLFLTQKIPYLQHLKRRECPSVEVTILYSNAGTQKNLFTMARDLSDDKPIYKRCVLPYTGFSIVLLVMNPIFVNLKKETVFHTPFYCFFLPGLTWKWRFYGLKRIESHLTI